MKINRREFLILTATFTAGCGSIGNVSVPITGGERTINAGPAGNYAADGVYTAFRNQGFFIVREGKTLVALSAICTHRKCKLNVEPDRSFHCPCHGSTFDSGGHVTHGPARRDLPVFVTSVSGGGHLLVTVHAA
jgi:Rieske Fe-S protein